ncbi:MAG TPA: FCD domain-containing protein [Actinocatenispora sp.]
MTDRDAALQARIVRLIHDRRLGPGEPLPTEPQLVDLLGASRNSVREAVRALRALGIVEIRRGLGMFVGEAPLRVFTPSLSFRIRAGEGGDVGSLRDLVEVRELLEVGLIGQVAGTLSTARLAALDALVRRMGEDPEADRSFHALLYESAGNALVLQLIQLFWDVYHDVEQTLGPPEDRAAEIEANHDRIVAALRARDAAAAQAAMRRHFTDVKARISRAVPAP